MIARNDIRQVRESQGLSGRSLASQAKIPPPALSEIETHKRALEDDERQRIEAIIGPVRVWRTEIDIPRGEA